MAYQPLPSVTKGGDRTALTTDEEVRDLLRQLLQEMRIMNRHLSLVTGETIQPNDLEEES
jgi:hypothetical protein